MSEKSIAERLQVKKGRTLAVIHAPSATEDLIGVSGVRTSAHMADVVLVFVTDQADLATRLPTVLSEMRQEAILWLAYPKVTSSRADDLNRDFLRDTVPRYGLDTVSQIAIDSDWSALRFKRVVPHSIPDA